MNTPFSTTNMIIRNKNVLVTSSSELNIYILIYIFSKNGVVEKEWAAETLTALQFEIGPDN